MAKRIVTDGDQMIDHINWRHIDGPMLVRANGEIRWLTLKERFLCWIGAIRFFEMNPITSRGTA